MIGAGGLGHMAIQILAAIDAPRRSSRSTSRPRRCSSPRPSAPTHGVLAGDDATAEIRELTKGRGTDLVLDFVGVDATIALAVAVARPLSDVTLVGIGMGTLPVQLLHGAVRGLARDHVLGLGHRAHRGDRARRGGPGSAPTSSGSRSTTRRRRTSDMAAGTLRGRAVIVP